MTPDRWTARPSGVSLPKAKCVHSRRTVPTRRSKYGFCHGDPHALADDRALELSEDAAANFQRRMPLAQRCNGPCTERAVKVAVPR